MRRTLASLVSVLLTGMFVLLTTLPAVAADAYSEDCDVEFTFDGSGVDDYLEYGGEEWDDSNYSMTQPFWMNGDTAIITLNYTMMNEDQGRDITFKVETLVDCSLPNSYKIIDGETETDDESYEFSETVDRGDSEYRVIIVEIYHLKYETGVWVSFDCRAWFGPQLLDSEGDVYQWAAIL